MVTYLFEPDPSVAARRVPYLAQNWKEHRPQDQIDVMSTTEQIHVPDNIGRYYMVQLKNRRSWIPINDEGVLWKGEIIRFLEEHPELSYDLVLLPDGPFMKFGVSGFFKQKWARKVVLDFRDTFARYPRFENSSLKVAVKSYYQKQILNNANGAVVVVNEQCLSLVEKAREMTHCIIPNGYSVQEIQ